MKLFTRCLRSLAIMSAFSEFALAANCDINVVATTRIKYDLAEIKFPKDCQELRITLSYEGKLAKNIMGHNLLISATSDMDAIISAALSAGVKKDYRPDHKGVIAATKLIGGGEKDSITVKRSGLKKGQDYMFFCTFPGHSALMRGKFIVE